MCLDYSSEVTFSAFRWQNSCSKLVFKLQKRKHFALNIKFSSIHEYAFEIKNRRKTCDLLLWPLDGDRLWAPAVPYLGGRSASVWIHPPALPARLPHCLTCLWRSTAHQGGLTPTAVKTHTRVCEDVLGHYPTLTFRIEFLNEWVNPTLETLHLWLQIKLCLGRLEHTDWM